MPDPVYDLQLGDNDEQRIFGGKVHPEEGRKLVRLLQDELAAFGFRIEMAPGVFDLKTEWAVREFQLYAALPKGAIQDGDPQKPYPLQLSQIDVPEAERYHGRISGTVNEQTRECMLRWKQNPQRRCPVVVTACTEDAVGKLVPLIGWENLWHPDQNQPESRVYVRDLSSAYEIPAAQLRDGVWLLLGSLSRLKSKKTKKVISFGPETKTLPNNPDVEVLPHTLVRSGASFQTLTPEEKSTFRVVRVVSEVECYAHFDVLNAYDPAYLSFGVCHWIIGTADPKHPGAMQAGEMGGFLAYLNKVDRSGFDLAFGRFGITTAKEWGEDGRRLFDHNQARYLSLLALTAQAEGKSQSVEKTAEAEYFRTWHVCHRTAMAGRYCPAFRFRSWDLARQRLRYILDAPLEKRTVGDPPPLPGSKIRDVCTSELAMALLLRWHVNLPSHVVRERRAGGNLMKAIYAALETTLPAGQKWDTGEWTDAKEAAVCKQIMAQMPESLAQNVKHIAQWQHATFGTLSRAAGSFAMALTGELPPLITSAPPRKVKHGQITKQKKQRAAPPSPAVPHGAIAAGSPIVVASTLSGSAFTNENAWQFGVYVQVDEWLPVPEEVRNRALAVTHLSLTLPGSAAETERQFGFRLPVKAGSYLLGDLQEDASDVVTLREAPGGPAQDEAVYELTRLAASQQQLEIDLARIRWVAALAERLRASATLIFEFDEDESIRKVCLDVGLTLFAEQRRTWRFTAAGHLDADGLFSAITVGDDGRSLELPLLGELGGPAELLRHLGFPLSARAAAELTLDGKLVVRIDETGALDFQFTGTLQGGLSVDLGSPLVRLSLSEASCGLTVSSKDGFAVSLNARPTLTLGLDPFLKVREVGKLISHIWEGGAQDHFLQIDWTPTAELSIAQAVVFHGPHLQFDRRLLASLLGELQKFSIDASRRLASFAGSVLGSLTSTWVTFAGGDAPKVINQTGERPQLAVPIRVNFGGAGRTLLEVGGNLMFGLPAHAGPGLCAIEAGDFQCSGEVDLVVGNEEIASSFSGLLSLHISARARFKLAFNPASPSLVWEKGAGQQIAVCCPALLQSDGAGTQNVRKLFDEAAAESKKEVFTFELDSFAIGSAGLSLRGGVRSERVDLGNPVHSAFQSPLAVKAPDPAPAAATAAKSSQPHRIGEIEFRDSKLVYACLQATATLCYFDDAQGTFTLAFCQRQNNSLQVMGSLEIAKLAEFHVDRLYMTYQVDMLHLETTVERAANGKLSWQSAGRMSGRIRFLPPAGKNAADLRELCELFKGVTLEFEELDVLKLHFDKVKLTVPPKRFVFGEYLEVEARGVELLPVRAKEDMTTEQMHEPPAAREYKILLLGDLRLLKLPGLDAQLSLSDMSLTVKRDSWLPSFGFGRIGAQLALQSGFKMQGEFAFIETEAERGFAGAFALDTEAMGQVRGMLKLVSVRTRNGDTVPAFAFYSGIDLDVALPYGFFLRQVGLGLGVRQRLRNFNDELPLRKRLNRIVDGEAGIPFPGAISSWEAAEVESSSKYPWMLVAYGGITFLRLPRTTEHLIAGSVVLAIDHHFDVIAGVNVWLFTAPVDITQDDFAAHPCARGAIGISPREKQVYAYFRTMRKPKMSPRAPQILADVFNAIDTSMRFLADPRGFIQEIGWPWENRVQLQLGPLRGEIQSGFRFGLYRGVLTAGMNLGWKVTLDASASTPINLFIGRAEIRFSIFGEAYFRASLIGAVTTAGQLRLLGDVRFGAMVRLAASLNFQTKILFKPIRIRFNVSLEVALSAALTLAIENSGIGFIGEAAVAVGVCGYHLAGRIGVALNTDRVNGVRQSLDQVLPAPLNDDSLLAFDGSAPRSPLAGVSSRTPLAGRHAEDTSVFKSTSEYASTSRIVSSPAATGTSAERPERLAAAPLWNCFVWQDAGQKPAADRKPLRLLLFPRPGHAYYSPGTAANAPARFAVQLGKRGRKRFRGFLGSAQGFARSETGLLTWSENLEQRVETGDEEPLTVRELLNHTLPSSSGGTRPGLCWNQAADIDEHVDPRVREPLSSNSDDETSGVAPSDYLSPYLRRDHSFDQKVAAACTPRPSPPTPLAPADAPDAQEPEPEHNPGVLFHELVELLKDPEAVADRDRQGYGYAPALRLILVFDDNEGEPLLLEDCIDLTSSHFVGGVAGAHLLLPAEEQPQQKLRVEYDLLPGHSFQSEREIALTWDFLARVTELDGQSRPAPQGAYSELESYVVSRVNLRRPDEAPVLFHSRPLWLLPNGAARPGEKLVLVRPQFQLIDSKVDGFTEDDLLQYTVEARNVAGRSLASCVINVQRRLVRLLSAPAQAQVLQPLPTFETSEQKQREGKLEAACVYSLSIAQKHWHTKVESLDATVRRDFERVFGRVLRGRTLIDHLCTCVQLRYRIVAAGRVGSYGLSQPAGVGARLETAAGAHQLDVQFLHAEQSRPLPWHETKPLPATFVYQPMGSKHAADAQVLLVAELTADALDRIFKTLELAPGQAVEFYVGLEALRDTTPAVSQPLSRSPLVRCRHAILASGEHPATKSSEPGEPAYGTEYLRSGLTVDQLELLPLQSQRLPAWPRQVQYVSAEQISTSVLTKGAQQGAAPLELSLSFPHLPAARLATDMRALASQPHPVVGYRVYRVDAYDEGSRLPAPELTLEVMPETLYRSRPLTIDMHAERSAGGGASADGWVADWNVRARQGSAGITDEPVLVPLPSRINSVTIESAPLLVDKRVKDWFADCRRYFINAPSGALCAQLLTHTPLHYRGDPEPILGLPIDEAAKHLRDRFRRLVESVRPEIDPYGLWAAELFGLSCELTLSTEDGLLLIPHASQAAEQSSLQRCVYFAEDGELLLNVIRVLGRSKLRDSSGKATPGARTAILFQLLGITPLDRSAGTIVAPCDQERAALWSTIEREVVAWLLEVEARWDRLDAPGSGAAAFIALEAAPAGDVAATSRDRSRATLSVAVRSDGSVHCRLPIPDLYAKHYRILVAPVRRYDALLRQTGHLPEMSLPPLPIADGKSDVWAQCRVLRTQELVPHNLMALPMVSGIHGLVFVHPAAFAAAASAVQAVRGQYSGQHVSLERQIEDRSWLVQQFASSGTALGAVDWAGYQRWLEAEVQPVPPTEDALLQREDGTWPEVSRPAAMTDVAMYGADRYVYPDLPAYYQYRMLAFSTAGAVASPVKGTEFVTPLYSDSDDARQRPAAPACACAEFSEGQLTLLLQLPIPERYYRQAELAQLWRDAEELVEVGDGKRKLRFGQLPDLMTQSQIYLSLPQDVLLPIARIAAPRLTTTETNPQHRLQFLAEAQATGALMTLPTGPAVKIAPVPVYQARPEDALEAGALYLKVTLDLRDPRCEPLRARLREPPLVEIDDGSGRKSIPALHRYIYLRVGRAGVCSPFAYHAPKAAAGGIR